MRYLVSLLFAATASTLFSQGKTVAVEPHWNYLDVRQVNTATRSKVTVGDSVAQESVHTSTCRLNVPDVRKDHFVLALRTSSSAGLVGDMRSYVTELPEVFRDSVMKRMQHVVADLYTPMMDRETRFKVNRTGKMIEVVEEVASKNDPRPAIVEAVKELQSLSRENKRRTGQQLEAHREQMVDSLYDAFAQLQTNSLNSVLEPYANVYPETGSTRQPTTLKSVDVPGLGAIGDLPAIMETGLDELSEKSLTARIVITGDADALLKILLARDPKSKLKKQDLSLVKETVYTMDRSTGWPTHASTEWRLRMGSTSAKVNTSSTYTAEKP
jgi:hypothetical protein